MNYLIEPLIDSVKRGHRFYRPEEIKTAKRRYPLKRLMKTLGDAPFISEKAIHSPFHLSESPTFKVFQYEYTWVFRCCAKCGSRGDQIDYLEARFKLTTGEAIALLCKLADLP